MKFRSLLLSLAALVLVLLSVAAAGLFWILAPSPLPLLKGGVVAEPRGAAFVPKQAPVMVSLLVSPDRLEAYGTLAASPGNRRRSRRELKQVEENLLAGTGLNYEREIQPWLGDEIALAVTSLDFDRQPDNGVQPGYLLAASTRDRELAKEFLQLSYSREAIGGRFDLVFETYQGVNLIAKRYRETPPNNRFLASAVVGDFVLFANDEQVLRDAINNLQVPGLNLQHSPAYREALQTIREPRIGIAYANLPAASAWIANAPIPETPDIIQSLAVTLSLKSQGLVAQTALIGVAGEEDRAPVLSQPVGALAYVPPDSLWVAASTNLHQFWEQVEMGLAANSPLQQLLKQTLNRLQAPLGLNLPEEVFRWVRGEYSLALVPHPDGGQPDWLFVAERVPGKEAGEAIARWDDLAEEQGYSVGKLPVGEQAAVAWTKLRTQARAKITRLDAEVRGVHATAGNYEIFSTSIESLSQAISGSGHSLVDSQKFQQAIRALPADNDGYFYVDWDRFQPILEESFPVVKVFEFGLKPLVDNLRSFTLSSQGSSRGIRRATAFFNLGVR